MDAHDPDHPAGYRAGVTLLVNCRAPPQPSRWARSCSPFALYSLLRHPDAQRVVSAHWAWIAGFIGGVTSTIFGAGGPPYAMYLSQRGLSKEQYRATLGLATLTSISIRTVAFLLTGILLDPKVWLYAVFVVPAASRHLGGEPPVPAHLARIAHARRGRDAAGERRFAGAALARLAAGRRRPEVSGTWSPASRERVVRRFGGFLFDAQAQDHGVLLG